jgi:hypothetical protein
MLVCAVACTTRARTTRASRSIQKRVAEERVAQQRKLSRARETKHTLILSGRHYCQQKMEFIVHNRVVRRRQGRRIGLPIFSAGDWRSLHVRVNGIALHLH